MILTDERAIQAVKAALRWMKAHAVQWLKTEEKVYSLEFNFAGTMDGLAYVDSCPDPACCTQEFKHSLCLIDFKTSNQLKDEYCLQTAAYQQALQEEHGTIIENRWLLRLGKSDEEAGKFETWRLPAETFDEDLSGFIACLRLTRITKAISERMSQQKSGIRAVKKEQRETAKALAKEQAKLQKAMDKAAAKIAKEAEKVRVKAEAKAAREALKAQKHMEKIMPVTTAIMKMMAVDIDSAELPEGARPRTDDVEFIGGAPCTSTSNLKKDSTPLDTTVPPRGPDWEPACATLSSSPSPTIQEKKTLPIESTSSTVETKYEETEIPCKLPME